MAYERDGDSLSISFTQSDEDIAAFQKFVASQSRLAVWIRWTVLPIIVVLAIAYVARMGAQSSDSPFASAIVWLIIFVVIWFVVFRQIRRSTIRAGRQGVQGKTDPTTRVTIRPERLVVVEEYSQTQRLWPGVPRIGSTDSHIFFFIGELMAYVVPRRAFPDDQSFREFRDAAEMYRRSAPAGVARPAALAPPIAQPSPQSPPTSPTPTAPPTAPPSQH
ncbi:MAG TPA: YcxB family protein [Phycisphaerae bacterium]|nr:YcxB family protein [Phycisphaerae bacterium]HRW51347.1 YcxB family protein [Phycisphaerae bacterium]